MTPREILPIAIPLVVLVLILLRSRKPKQLNIRFLWVVPLLVILGIGTGLYFSITQAPHAPFGPVAYGGFALALALGAFAGWHRGKAMDIHRDPRSGLLMAKPSLLGVVLIVGLLVVRRGLDAFLMANADAWHLNAIAITDAFMLFAVGLVVAQRVEMFIRGKAILDAAPPREPAPAG